MVWYEVIRKEDNAKVAVESTRPKDGTYNTDIFEIWVVESESHPKFGMDDEGNPTVLGHSEDAMLLSEYVGASQKQKELETKVTELTARVATAETAVTALTTKITKAEADIVALKAKNK